MDYLENNHGAVIVFEEANYIYWSEMDPAKPYDSLARRILENPLIGPFPRMLKVTLDLIKKYKIDAVIEFAHWGCRHLNNGSQILREELRARNIPLLVIDSDCLDSRNYSKEQIRTRIDAFLEILDNNKQERG